MLDNNVRQRDDKELDRRAVAIDYESFYSTKEKYSLPTMPTWQYCADPRFDAYLVAICGWEITDDGVFEPEWKEGETVSRRTAEGSVFRKLPDGRQLFIGRPERFPDWDNLRSRTLIAHNGSFDESVTLELVKRGLLPKWLVENEWACTADLSAYLLAPRNLKGACKYLLGKEISKEVRENMDGKHDYELSQEDYRDLVEYGGSDAVECHDIWLGYAAEWPEMERKLSVLNRESTIHGVRLDLEKVKAAIKELKRYQAELEADIPWMPEKPAGSLPALRAAVVAVGLEPPPTFKKDSPQFLEWLAEHDDVPFIKARQHAVSLAVHLSRLQTMLDTVDPQGYSHPVFLYAGSHTLRFSGKSDSGKSSGNLLNLPRKPLFAGNEHVFGGKGIDVRGMYIADPGKTFVIADWSQVEPRITMWLAGDTHMVEAMQYEGNLYQANAVAMGWCKSKCDLKHTDADMYKMAKAISIGATYGLGAAKFVDYCKGMGFDLPSLPVAEWPELDRRTMFILRNVARIKGDLYSERNAHKVGQVLKALRVVDDWRGANGKIVAMWHRFEDTFKQRVAAGKSTVAYRLPNGYVKRYFNPCLRKEPTVEVDENGRERPSFRIAMSAEMRRGDPPRFLTGGAITENLVQGFGRQLLGNVIVEMSEKHPQWRYVFSVYDEVVLECPKEDAEDCLAELSHVMCHGDRIAPFTEGLPLEVEGTISDRYLK